MLASVTYGDGRPAGEGQEQRDLAATAGLRRAGDRHAHLAVLEAHFAHRGLPTDAGTPPTGIVTNALFAVALPPPSVAVTWHCRWWPVSWPLTV